MIILFWIRDKVVLFEEKFYIENLSTMECEVRERKLLSVAMGVGNWLIQLDADEYFLDFKKFVSDLREYDSFLTTSKQQIQISAYLVNIYKFVEDGFLYVDEPTRCVVATNLPNYKVGRNTRKRIIYTKNLIFHETLSRSEKELEFKFKNWGHNAEINPYFLEKWKSATKNNYKDLKDLFYLEPHKWKKLGYCKGNTIDELINNFPINDFAPGTFFLIKKNFGQWFKFLFKK
jgi:hypothetical protein